MPGTKIPEAVRRERIIAAAFAIAAEQGLAAVTIRSVAERADTSAGLVMFYFETKDELVLALLDWVLATTTALSVGPDILANPSAFGCSSSFGAPASGAAPFACA
jgi:AcrR family transcriptional regulator